MAFFTSAINILQTLVVAIGAGLAVWGVINLLEGYGNDNPGAKSQGIKQLMAGVGVVLIGTQLVPLLANLFYLISALNLKRLIHLFHLICGFSLLQLGRKNVN